jgi:hypothetical protein
MEVAMHPVTHLVVHALNRDAAPVVPRGLGSRRPRPDADAVAIRIARPADASALAELAEVDGAPPAAAARLVRLARDPSKGTVLVADFHGHPAAALDVEHGAAVADPFESSASLVDLLRLRARQLRPLAR